MNPLTFIIDMIFIILEAAILYYVRLEWKQGKEAKVLSEESLRIVNLHYEHSKGKYRRYKGKKIIKEILKQGKEIE